MLGPVPACIFCLRMPMFAALFLNEIKNVAKNKDFCEISIQTGNVRRFYDLFNCITLSSLVT